MKLLIKSIVISMLTLLAGMAVMAQEKRTPTVNYDGELPPLIDRQTFFGDPQYSSAKISPNGKKISFLKKYKGVKNVWVKGINEPFDKAEPVTADTTRPVSGYFWTKDGERILFVQDKGGNENYHIYAVDPDAEDNAETGVPPAKDLTPYEDIQARIYSVPDETPGEIVVGLNDRNPQYHDVYRLDLSNGERTLVYKNESGIAGWQTDLKGNLRLAVRQTEDGGTEILRVDADTLKPVYRCSFEETCSPIRFHKDNRRVYMQTNKGSADLTRLVLLNPKNGETSLVESDPEKEVDFGGAIFSDKTDELIATYYVDKKQRVYPRNDKFRKDYKFLKEQLEGELSFHSSTEDESRMIVSASSDVDPGSVYLFSREEHTLERLYRSRPNLPSKHLGAMKPIEYEARDGTRIPAYLTLPKGVKAQNLPVIVNPHGGPWSRDTWGYDPYAQFFANRGYAVLQPNFRGSTGYGQEFLNDGNKEWGTGIMQHDITDGVRYLIDQGIADADRVGIFGGSYGGYATLAGLTFTPDLYAAGASYVGPSNLITLIESIPPYWTPIQKMFTKRVGELEDPEDKKRMKEQSPYFHAENIDNPLLIIQGANDPRVKKQESDQIVVAARDNDIPIEYMVAPEEGHGFEKEDNRLAVATKLEWFFGEHLGGRYQKGTEDPTQKRLERLNVPVDSVSLPDTASSSGDDENHPEYKAMEEVNGAQLKTGSMSYDVTVEAGGRSVEMTIERTISRQQTSSGRNWVVTDITKAPRANVTDSVFLQEGSLKPIRRSIKGPLTLQVSYSDTGAAGTIKVKGKSISLDKSYDETVFASGSNLRMLLAAMPLKKDLSTSIKVLNEQQRTLQTYNLKVTGTKELSINKSTYQTYVVEFESEDGSVSGIMHLSREAPHYVIRSQLKQTGPRGSQRVQRTLTSMSLD